MAIVAHILERVEDPGDMLIDGIELMIVAIDDAVDTTAALIQARGATILNANNIPVPSDYFTSNRLVTGTWDAASDFTVVSGKNIAEVIA